MNIFMFSTCVMDGTRTPMLERMLASVAQANNALAGKDELSLFLLLQKQTGSPDIAMPNFVQVSCIPDMISLSAARNRLLAPLLGELSRNPDSLAVFPDDDCWYPEGALQTIIDGFSDRGDLDFLFCRYSSSPISAPAGQAAVQATTSQVVRNASSNTMFLRGPIMAQIGGFDEALGVGTPNGGAEDLDIALAAQAIGRRTEYFDAALIGHRNKDAAVRARYYKSGLIVLARYAHHGTMVEFLRKLLVGCYLWLRGELALRDLAEAYRASLHP